MYITEGLEPKAVLRYFERISEIPRGSGNMEAISAFVLSEAKKDGLICRTDEHHNVVVFVPASAGYENAPTVMLQGHMDMVCEKTLSSSHDFKKDPLKLKLDGDFLYAEETTLGGDDGIAVAMMLAIMADKTLVHPALECVFTTDEETGMFGAEGLDASDLQAKYLLNLDNECEGEFIVSCTGGARFEGTLALHLEKACGEVYRLSVQTEKGGHSGTEIHRNRPNANFVLFSWIAELRKMLGDLRLISVNGGRMDNAICTYSEALVMTSGKIDEAFFDEKYQAEFAQSDDRPHCKAEKCGVQNVRTFSEADFKAFLLASSKLVNGVIAYSKSRPEMLETSLNLGIVKTEEAAFKVRYAVRSAVEEEKFKLLSRLSDAFSAAGGTHEISGNYPGWAYREDSVLRDLAVSVYSAKYTPLSGRTPHVEAIHAGLECGLLLEKMPDLDIVSVGADAIHIHTPNEKMRLSSVKRMYAFVLDVLKEIRK